MMTREDFIRLADLVGIEVIRLDALLMEAERKGWLKSEEKLKELEWELNRLKQRGAA